MLTAAQLADHLGVSRARISQYVSEGKLTGCYDGEGRSRRFDPDRVAQALKSRLDPGQMMGNGAKTKSVIRDVAPAVLVPDTALTASDMDRYELARIQSAEEDARRKRRDNQRDEGRWVLAEEVSRHTARAMSQEVAQFETVLRDGARAIADNLGVDFREARKLLIDQWRAHRSLRAGALDAYADSTPMSDTEKEANT